MADKTFLTWPFFDDAHRELAENLEIWAGRHVDSNGHADDDVDRQCRDFVGRLGRDGWLRYVVPKAYGGHFVKLDVRSLCLIRDTLGQRNALAEFAFAMQGLGSASISLFGSEELKHKYLPDVCQGKRIAAFALSEPDAGSDVAAMKTTARVDGDHYVIDGTKTWISNGGIAHQYVLFARTGEAPGAKGLSAFVVDAETPGLTIAERLNVIAPHPLATLSFKACRVPKSQLLGKPGEGFKIAMATLDIFRATVGAAALGLARRALDEAVDYAKRREAFGQKLADFQLTQAKLADMAVDIDAAALLVYRAAWTKDKVAERVTREASMAKLYATEAAQRVIDAAVQIHGGVGVVSGRAVERLYREIRSLRIYEGATEIQKLVIAGQVLAAHGNGPA